MVTENASEFLLILATGCWGMENLPVKKNGRLAPVWAALTDRKWVKATEVLGEAARA
jgi:hypothetical protein